MGFSEDIKALAERITQIGDKITTEEATKMSLILPFFQLLGYDVFNPSEFCPEYTADVGIKKGEKVDYAILQNDEPVILIECKWCGEPLTKHASQLFRYFSTTPAKFGILTNGYVYRFYTDLDETNKMDLTPFLELDLHSIKEAQIAELKKFSKDVFDKDSIFSTAEELKYSNLIKEVLQKELDSPSDEFTRFILSDIYDALKTQKVINKFKPIVKKSFSSFINELLNQRISSALKSDEEKESAATAESVPEEADIKANKIITTEQEIEAYYIIKGIISSVIDVKRITYRDAESYFSILIDDNNRKPVCRLNLDTKKMQIFLLNEDKTFERIYIESLNDIYNYKDRLIDTAQKYI
ncbi:MAG: type I restriction enzyme HsdR N-terminal domain-containing protein [Lachnospiraceae bacterium]|nr:type I restriction enzyme HsdR N-terminal domain-containing protein [Lachnospiraceae bacterium]